MWWMCRPPPCPPHSSPPRSHVRHSHPGTEHLGKRGKALLEEQLRPCLATQLHTGPLLAGRLSHPTTHPPPTDPPAPISLCVQTRPTPPLGLAPPLLAPPCLPFPSPAPLPHDRSPSPLPRVRTSRARQRRGASRHALRGPGRTTRPRRRSSSGCSANTHVRSTERGARRGIETHHAVDDRDWDVTGLSGTHLGALSIFLILTSSQLLTRSVLVWPCCGGSGRHE
jgi:hypothetical protein